jgi:hypothetical protein
MRNRKEDRKVPNCEIFPRLQTYLDLDYNRTKYGGGNRAVKLFIKTFFDYPDRVKIKKVRIVNG